MIIRIIEDEEQAYEFADKIREVVNSNYTGMTDDLFRIARTIESSGDVTLKDIQNLQSALADCRKFADDINEVLKEVGHAA